MSNFCGRYTLVMNLKDCGALPGSASTSSGISVYLKWRRLETQPSSICGFERREIKARNKDDKQFIFNSTRQEYMVRTSRD